MPTVGEILRTERERKGLTIKDIEKGTSIRALYLSAIEEDNYKVVPGEVYLKGFIRNYATHLGLDGQEMVKLYRESKVEPVSEVEADTAPSSLPDKEPLKETTVLKQSIPPNIRTSIPSFPKWLAVAASAVIIAGGGYWLYSAFSTPLSEMTKPSPGTTTQQQGTPPAQNVPQQSVQPKATSTAPAVLSAKYNDACWTQVTADGKHIYEGTPTAGQTLSWEGKKNITIKLGNAAAVDITFNGKPFGKLGGRGEVVVKSFTP